ncbi:MAG: hypothetical protein GWP70_03850 [Proteobacteria bacterium]|nr:hypothetical protein [Pseudomonadota bacterium]
MLGYAVALAEHRATQVADEQTFSALWSDQLAHLPTLTEQAVRGGLLADRMAWVFIAGYQSALRHTFSELPTYGLAAFAVSEDRKGQPPLPGVTAAVTGGTVQVSGYKTWVACSATLAHLVIKSDRGPQAAYYCIARQTTGLTLTNKYGGFLAEMSQGVAQLENTPVQSPLDAQQVGYFGIRETLYIYMAFCAWAGKHASSATQCQELITRLGQLVQTPPEDEAALAELRAVDDAVQALRANVPDTATANWQQDQRLISMYSPSLQKRQA